MQGKGVVLTLSWHLARLVASNRAKVAAVSSPDGQSYDQRGSTLASGTEGGCIGALYALTWNVLWTKHAGRNR